jgi:hypothetical protein
MLATSKHNPQRYSLAYTRCNRPWAVMRTGICSTSAVRIQMAAYTSLDYGKHKIISRRFQQLKHDHAGLGIDLEPAEYNL